MMMMKKMIQALIVCLIVETLYCLCCLFVCVCLCCLYCLFVLFVFVCLFVLFVCVVCLFVCVGLTCNFLSEKKKNLGENYNVNLTCYDHSFTDVITNKQHEIKRKERIEKGYGMVQKSFLRTWFFLSLTSTNFNLSISSEHYFL